MSLRHRALLLSALAAAPSTLGPATAAAQQGRAITLEEAITLGQQRGYQSRGVRATRDAARYRDRAFSSRLLPQLSLAGTLPDYNRSNVQILDDSGRTVFLPLQQTNASVAMRLSQRLPLTGGDLFVSSSLARFQLSGSQTRETWSSLPLVVGLRQDIFRPNILAWERREQAVRSERDERAYRAGMEDVALAVTDLFFNVYAARVGLANAVANAAVNDTLYRINTGRYGVGRIAENELLQSELVLLRSRAALDGAQLEYARAVEAFRIALNLPPATPVEIAVPSVVPAFDADTALAAAQALRNGMVVSEVQLQEVQARRRVTEARLATGIGATVLASYGYNASDSAFRLAYRNLLETRQFSVTVQLPLWQWGARGETVRAAQADRDRVTAQNEASMDQLALDAKFAALQLALARRNVELLIKADSVAGRRYDVAYNRYVIGRIFVDNLFIAQQEKDQAVAQFAEGLRRYWLAHYRLRRITLFDFSTGQPLR